MHQHIRRLLLLLPLLLSACGETPIPDAQALRDAEMARLEAVRGNKRERLLRYLAARKQAAQGLADERLILDAFAALHEEYRGGRLDGGHWREVETRLERYFVEHLGAFYDLLMVDAEGTIFFTLRREADFGRNINDPMFQGLGLHQALSSPPDSLRFVDFEHYQVSAEPASFYVVPLREDGAYLGSVVLQLPVDRINLYLSEAREPELGRTGEVYMVNDRQLMMSQSRFIDDVTVLKKRIDTEALRTLDGERSGRRIIRDYRDVWVYSAYERLDYEGARWRLIAERDEEEVLSGFYLRHQQELLGRMLAALPEPREGGRSGDWPAAQKVDFKELRKSRERPLATRGVATCTAVAAYRPHHFAYLAHVSPTDAIYVADEGAREQLGDEYSDFLGAMLGRIDHYDVLPAQRGELRFVLAANHADSFRRGIARLLRSGADLSQIRLLYAPEAASIDLLVDPAGHAIARLNMADGRRLEMGTERLPDLGALLRRVMDYRR